MRMWVKNAYVYYVSKSLTRLKCWISFYVKYYYDYINVRKKKDVKFEDEIRNIKDVPRFKEVREDFEKKKLTCLSA